MKIVFLFSRLASYMLACIELLLNKNADIEVYAVHYPSSNNAPFVFNQIDRLFLYDRLQYKNAEDLFCLLKQIMPDAIFCSGWFDKEYVKVCGKYSGIIPTVLSLDNQWEARFKQYVACLLSRTYLLSKFSDVWVPGAPQVKYARYLGFKPQSIHEGYYCADTNMFDTVYRNNREKKKKNPKRFIFVGRYSTEKGIENLWDVFREIQETQPNKWELWCFGVGPLYEQRIQHKSINHLGFCQPKDLPQYLAQTGIFVLPSLRENWGVVVHEFAIAGFPLICSDAVGANSAFLKDNENGYIFEAGNKKSLRNAMVKMICHDDTTLNKMSDASHELGMNNTMEIWCQKIKQIIS